MRANGGFTLIEIIVVVLIIAGLATLVGPRILDQFSKANEKTTMTQISNLESSIKLFKLDNGFYPETSQGLQALIDYPSTGREPKNYAKNGYLDASSVPLDGWSNEFIYVGPDQTQNGTYEIRSMGEDGVANTEDDISSAEIR